MSTEDSDPYTERLLELYEQQLAEQDQLDPRRHDVAEKYRKTPKDPPRPAGEDIGEMP